MPKFLVDWSINGTTEVDAASKDQAQLVFNSISKREHADNGDLEQHAEPETKEDREAWWARWRDDTTRKEEAIRKAEETSTQCTGTAAHPTS